MPCSKGIGWLLGNLPSSYPKPEKPSEGQHEKDKPSDPKPDGHEGAEKPSTDKG